jgi:hypothetical protein
MRIEVSALDAGGITRAQFDAVLDRLQAVYGPTVAARAPLRSGPSAAPALASLKNGRDFVGLQAPPEFPGPYAELFSPARRRAMLQ